jgi:REP element-mobilizing transposase RayT
MSTQLNNEFLKLDNLVGVTETQIVNGMKVFESKEQTQPSNDVDEQENIQSDLDYLQQEDPYVTSYVCLLAPRFEEHLLMGDVSDQLYVWMRDICISFGWQLKFIDIKPKYLHWIMAVGITTYPTQFMKTVCKESSIKIFDDFPKFQRKNVSDEFWAPWYFVGVGQAPYSQDSIQSFIRQIRMEQGLR